MKVCDSMIKDVKKALRISSAEFDGEIKDLIDACKLDLSLAGVALVRIDDRDPLIKRAVLTYAKANFGYGEDTDKYQRYYDALKLSLREAGGYNALE